VPRAVNLALALCLAAFLVPVFTHLSDVTRTAQVLLIVLSVPFVLLVLMCLSSALRPGSLGRLLRRLRTR
jgi:hypothetical protein